MDTSVGVDEKQKSIHNFHGSVGPRVKVKSRFSADIDTSVGINEKQKSTYNIYGAVDPICGKLGSGFSVGIDTSAGEHTQ